MKLQYAADTASIKESTDIFDQVKDYIDIFEVDGIFYFDGGMDAIKVIKERYPDKEINFDNKYTGQPVVDIRDMEHAFELGADIVTTVANLPKKEQKIFIDRAHELGKKIAVEFSYMNDMRERLQMMERLNADVVIMGANWALGSEKKALATIEFARRLTSKPLVAIQGGVGLKNFEAICRMKPDIIISGRGIYTEENPCEAVRQMKALMNKYER